MTLDVELGLWANSILKGILIVLAGNGIAIVGWLGICGLRWACGKLLQRKRS